MVSFSLNEANELAHALLAQIGRDTGIRLLSIKGLVADRYGLRKPRVAADADVIVEPSRFDEFCRLLTGHGWHLRVEREVPSLLGPHSVTFIRDDWPNDIDAHVRFPGFFATDAEVFERLWQTRGRMEVAHVDVSVPSRGASAVIAALHAVRYSKSARHAGELEQVAHLLIDDFSPEEREEFIDVARVGRAQWVLRELFDLIGRPYELDADARQQHLWNTNRATIEDGAAVSWLHSLRAAPLHQKPAVLVRALWISRADIPRNDPTRLPTAREAWAHRLLRWRRGGVALMHYVKIKR
ncbi:hypothetical protein ACFWHT_03415 [Microbacterium sp. NPDC058342]|uniref:hypothetical protein n=1 Tax=Microbacterium sp. NPDC058342 TaxID=3346454 RepID=UPI00364E760A